MKKRILFSVLIMVLMASFPSLAKVKAITGLTISATHSIEPGDILSEIGIDDGSGYDEKVRVSLSTGDCVFESCKLSGTGSRFINVGDKITLTAVIAPLDPDTKAFTGTYSRSNIKVTGGGTFESCSVKNGSLTVKIVLKPVSGPLNAPEDPAWKGGSSYSSSSQTSPGSSASSEGSSTGPGSSSGTSGSKSSSTQTSNLGKAVWTAPSGSTGYYEVWLYRGPNVIHKFTEIKGTSAACYPYMTKKGSYYFKVRTIPVTAEEKKYAKASEWVVSDEYYIDEEHVSGGIGADSSSMKNAGWNKVGSDWYYKYPDGTFKKNGWEKVNDKWYLFDSEGRMLTGKQSTKNGEYFLAPEGDMKTGWIAIDKIWYYFDPDPASQNQGAMLKETFIKETDGATYYLTKTGAMATGWVQIGENWYHFAENGNLSRNTIIDTFFVNEEGIWVKTTYEA